MHLHLSAHNVERVCHSLGHQARTGPKTQHHRHRQLVQVMVPTPFATPIIIVSAENMPSNTVLIMRPAAVSVADLGPREDADGSHRGGLQIALSQLSDWGHLHMEKECRKCCNTTMLQCTPECTNKTKEAS